MRFLILLILLWTLPAQAGDIANLARLYNPSLSGKEAARIEKSTLHWTGVRGINLHSFLAIIVQESKFRTDAEGKGGERGLCQISRTCLKELKRVYGEEFEFGRLFEIDYNLMVGTLHYRYCTELAGFRRREAIARFRTTFRPERSGYYAWMVLRYRKYIERRLN